ncbi:MAG: LacI family DNA-binding transcriptional regulator [Candidatus Promineifilaceae bacterium]
MSTNVTIRDVARHAGVGVGTVSRVLNDSESVRDSTRVKVLSAIEELNYSPSSVARYLSGGKTMAVGVLVPFFTNDSVVRRLQGIVSALGEFDYDLVLFDVEKSDNKEGLLMDIVQRSLVDGFLILSLLPVRKDMERFLETGIPAVVVDAVHPDLPSVFVDNEYGAWLATRHLLDLGHRRIGYLSDYPDNPFNHTPVVDRFNGYLRALDEAAVTYDPELYVESCIDRHDAREKAALLLGRTDRPTAVFAYCDMQAIGIIEAAHELGLRVPQDISVIGYDGIEAAEFMQLTTVRQSLFDSGVRGARLLLQVMDGSDPPEREIVLPTELVVRATTAPPADA